MAKATGSCNEIFTTFNLQYLANPAGIGDSMVIPCTIRYQHDMATSLRVPKPANPNCTRAPAVKPADTEGAGVMPRYIPTPRPGEQARLLGTRPMICLCTELPTTEMNVCRPAAHACVICSCTYTLIRSYMILHACTPASETRTSQLCVCVLVFVQT